MLMMLLLRPAAAPHGSATGSSKTRGIERSALSPSVTPARAEILACARARARRWRRGARRWCATAPRFNNCVEGAYGIARFAEREAVESDGHTRSTCGVRELRDSPVRRSVRQWAAAARRPTSIVCWWRSGDAGGAADRRRAGDDGPRLRPPRSNKPRDLRFGVRSKPSARVASPRPILRLAYANRFSGALSICRTQQIARGLHTRHRERRTHSKRGRQRRFASASGLDA